MSKDDYQATLNLFNTICTSMPKATKLTNSREAAIKRIFKTYTDNEVINAFKKAQASKFLRGECNNKGHENWKCTFDWIIKEANMAKVLDGNYDDRFTPDTNDKKKRKNEPHLCIWMKLEDIEFIRMHAYQNNWSIKKINNDVITNHIKYLEKTKPSATIAGIKELMKDDKIFQYKSGKRTFHKENSENYAMQEVKLSPLAMKFLCAYAYRNEITRRDAYVEMLDQYKKDHNIQQSLSLNKITMAEKFEEVFGIRVDPALRPCGIINCEGVFECNDSCKYKHMKPSEFWNQPYKKFAEPKPIEKVQDFPLTAREKEILEYKDQGYSFNKIADKIGTSKTTAQDNYYKTVRLQNLYDENGLFRAIIQNLGRSYVGLFHTLYRAGVDDIEKLKQLSYDEALMLPGIGHDKASKIMKIIENSR